MKKKNKDHSIKLFLKFTFFVEIFFLKNISFSMELMFLCLNLIFNKENKNLLKR
jgi:hypothetical protein